MYFPLENKLWQILTTTKLWKLKRALQGSCHGTKPARVQAVLGQYPQVRGVTLGVV